MPQPNTAWTRSRVVQWIALAALLLGAFLITDSIQGMPVRPGYLAVLSLVCAALWIGAAPLIWKLAGRFPLHGDQLIAHAALHLVMAVLFAFLLTALFALGLWGLDHLWGQRGSTFSAAFRSAVYYFFLPKVLVYAFVAMARRANDLAVRSERIEGELTQARLDVLRMQMNPHFLFNTLNSVGGLVRVGEDEKALNVLARLGGVLRRSLEEEDAPEAPLETELAALDELIEIEHHRFGERLRYRVEASEETMPLLVPRWILQPLVENAIRHGVEASLEAGEVSLRARLESGTLRIEVEDDGPGPSADLADGIGLGNTRSRLETLYAGRASLTIEPRSPKGTRVTVCLPQPQLNSDVGGRV